MKELQSNLRNFGFRNSFFLHKNCNFVLIFLEDFISIDSPHKLASRHQPRYSTIRYCFILFLLFVILSSGKLLSLLKRIHFLLSSPKSVDSLLSKKQSYTFSYSLFKTFLISVTFLCGQKILVLSA